VDGACKGREFCRVWTVQKRVQYDGMLVVEVSRNGMSYVVVTAVSNVVCLSRRRSLPPGRPAGAGRRMALDDLSWHSFALGNMQVCPVIVIIVQAYRWNCAGYS
jgi:hypothetical protein